MHRFFSDNYWFIKTNPHIHVREEAFEEGGVVSVVFFSPFPHLRLRHCVALAQLKLEFS